MFTRRLLRERLRPQVSPQWLLDLSDTFLEAEHEASVQSADAQYQVRPCESPWARAAVPLTCSISPISGTGPWCDGTKPVRDFVRSANDAFVSSGPDGTLCVRVDTAGAQMIEFDASKIFVTCLTAMPSESADDGSPLESITASFRSGRTRICSLRGSIDISGSENSSTEPRVFFEFQQHQSSLSNAQ